MAKYLYGASVQEIQGYIFQTNKLREIVGASELVEKVCTELFQDQFEPGQFKEENLVTAAAGNVKYIFDDFEECSKIVLKFPKTVMESAPGISISQAVVSMNIQHPVQELETRIGFQRNRSITMAEGLMVIETARKTGGTAVEFARDGAIDLGQKAKLKQTDSGNKKLVEKITGSKNGFADRFPFHMSEIVKNDDLKNWLAVIHIDGNNLGKKIRKLGGSLTQDKAMAAFRKFSSILDSCTVRAAQNAFNQTVGNSMEQTASEKIPFRPVILGGDDFTGIIRADLAIDFTENFLNQFEKLTKENYKSFGEDFGFTENPFKEGLTACAGIAFIKASYPFHYGVKLSESLCQEAKKHSKNIDEYHSPSSMLFHKVQSSFVESYEDIIESELKAQENVYFNYGPYFIKQQQAYSTIHNLKTLVQSLNKKAAPKSGLRNWLNELKNNPERAAQSLQRIAALNRLFVEELHLSSPFPRESDGKKYTPIYDAVSLSNLK